MYVLEETFSLLGMSRELSFCISTFTTQRELHARHELQGS